ncbi:Homeodomain-like protein [Globomyces pollinis-pini]|nr:Homeodomain-like protein [Globomyces pollinis-pini]KAJ2999965.1 hypothetical protein HDV02_001222 [Globomyces sp. JEL0801]
MMEGKITLPPLRHVYSSYIQPELTLPPLTRDTNDTWVTNYSSSVESYKKRRQRTSQSQLSALKAMFEINPLPTAKQRVEMSKVTGMTPRAVQVWFQNRRQNLKRNQRPPSPVSMSSRQSTPEPESEFLDHQAVDALLDLCSKLNE